MSEQPSGGNTPPIRLASDTDHVDAAKQLLRGTGAGAMVHKD